MTPTANTATKPVVSNPALPTVIARPPYQSSGVRRVSLNRGSGGNQAATVEQPHVRVITATSGSLSTLCSPRKGEVERGQEVGGSTSVATEGLGYPDESEVSASGLAKGVARQADLRVLGRFPRSNFPNQRFGALILLYLITSALIGIPYTRTSS